MKTENEKRAWEMFRKSLGPNIWSSKDIFHAYMFGVICGILLLAPLAMADNEITIDQTGGDNFSLNIEQYGAKNEIKMYDDYSYQNTIDLWHLDGSDNNIRWGQGGKLDDASDTTFYYDGNESGGHYANLDIHGSYNNVSGWQANSGNGAHTYNQLIFSSYNDVYVEQRGDGAKTLNLTINNDGNDVEVIQKNTGHTATIDLSGSYGTTLNLLQQGYTSQTYSLSQNCLTVGGCGVTVTQE
jgi:hypothetical protein